ncbi:PQQ-binding-like beta-propeller repeat protein [candidate division KSB1 bacterium]|nr:PQQ-binding-like beta-propeller repeat protein [candidate division KSB1 bacterium]
MPRSIILTTLLILAGCHRGLRQPCSIETSWNKSLDLSNPVAQLWQSKLKEHPDQVIHLNDSLALIGDSRGGVTTLNLNSGDRMDRYWKPLKRPIQFYGQINSVLYLSSESENDIIAWDLKNAALLWKKEFDVDYDRMISVDSVLYLRSDSSVAKISARTGALLQNIQLEEKLAKGIAGAGDKIYICTESGDLQEFDQQLNSLGELDLNLPMVKAILQQGERLIAYNSRGSIRIVALENAHIEFSNDFGAELYAAPCLTNGLVIVPFAAGTVAAYSLHDASLEWSFSAASLLNLDLLITNRCIIVVYARGQVVSIDAKNGVEQWQYDYGRSLNFAVLTRKGILLGHRKEISLIGEKHAN